MPPRKNETVPNAIVGIRHDWPDVPFDDPPLASTSTRFGGVSTGPYASLNLGAHVGDNLAAVLENRRRFLRSYGITLDRLVVADQVHSTNVAVVREEDAGRGSLDPATALPKTDGLLTNVSGLALGVFVADCVPVHLFDPVRRVIGILHAGRRGLFDGILRAGLAVMRNAFGSKASDCVAILGPGICGACYEVSPELALTFRGRFGAKVVRGRYLDLRRAIAIDLCRLGVPAAHIVDTDLCTVERDDLFYSHRREGHPTGRMLSLIELNPR